MQLLHDYLLVKEVISDQTIEGTSLKVKYDDTERFMFVEIIKVSQCLLAEYAKYYPALSSTEVRRLVTEDYRIGNKLIINRVAKTPYKEGMYFISFKDVIGVEEYADNAEPEVPEGQLSLFTREEV